MKNKYLPSLRLRTLPLSMSGIILGSGMAYPLAEHTPRTWVIIVLALLTTVCLQTISNLSNELGDYLRGTDADQKGRAPYGMQAGVISVAEMKRLIGVFIVLSAVAGTALVWTSFGTLCSVQSAVFIVFGVLAIVAAMAYTLGKHNYGYKGLGDLGVFLFFGLLSTLGSYYLLAHTLTVEAALAAVAIAMPIVGVLNLNNVRDIDNDIRHGKLTFASRLGKTGGKVYHALLLMACYVLFVCIGRYWVLLTLPVIGWHVWYIFRHDGHALDIQMPVLMFTTITIALLAIV
ncbi:MAG: 1,4-dihydroxy-2-naphthoate octaprenyltransferase [Paludibacteraceae bacterium]|nr:1,4-dihydroxy-2-naphthoate octaprenyltransferase [Paludibacteraceae bacterium]